LAGPRLSEYLENVALAKEGLKLFMDAFYIQFFARGYKLKIVSLEDSLRSIIEMKDSPQRARPRRMISNFVDYHNNVYGELPDIGYGGGSPFVLRTAFCSTLPQLFDAFAQEGQGVIGNFKEITDRMREFRPKLEAICQR